MTPRRTIIGSILRVEPVRRPLVRRVAFSILIAIALFLTFFPERYRAAATLTPADPSSLGLSGTLGQLGAFNSVFGNQTAIEIALTVARSIYVRDIVAEKLDLQERLGFRDRTETHRWLEREVDIRSLRGGIIQIEILNQDPDLARDLISAYALATQERLAQINRRQTEYKRDVLLKLVTDASDRLARAQGAYDQFRLANRYAIPQRSIETIGDRIPALQEAIKAKEVQLAATRELYTDSNLEVQKVVAEISALRQQLAQAQATGPEGNSTIGRTVRASTQAKKLERELVISQSLYDGYMRYLEGTSVEDLTSTANVRVLEPPFVDSERQISYAALAAALALFLFWMAIEFYRVRPPVGERLIESEVHG
jgi:capsule polysaccharide export protein KpsE/RkpR